MQRTKFIFIFCSLLLSVKVLCGQVTQSELGTRLENKLKAISIKLYKAALDGKVKAYHSETKTIVFDLVSRKTLGMMLKTREDGKFDTIYFNSDSLVADLGIMMKQEVAKNWDVKQSIGFVIPYANFKWIGGKIIRMHFFYIDWKDCGSVLSRQELELISVYAVFKNMIGSEDLKNAHGHIWRTYTESSVTLSGMDAKPRDFAEFMLEEIQRYAIFKQFQKNAITLSDKNDKSVNWEEFKTRHTLMVKSQIENSEGELVDYQYNKPPQEFDSLEFSKDFNLIRLFQMRQGEKGEIVRDTYQLHKATVKKYLNPAVVRAYELILNEN